MGSNISQLEMADKEYGNTFSEVMGLISETIISLPNGKECLDAEIQKLAEKCNENFSAVPIDEVTHGLQKSLELWEKTDLNIAVTGETGAGKSSLVNAMRGLKPGDDGAAKVGVTETTFKPDCYNSPNNPNVMFWDLPGIGTLEFEPTDYLKKVHFHRYDFFIILGSKRFQKVHIDLAKEIENQKKKFYFVRTKMDEDLRNEKRDNPKTFNEGKVLQNIRDDCNSKFKDHMSTYIPQVFLLSSYKLDRFDFNLLIEILERDLPMLKKLKLVLSLPNLSPDIIRKKKQLLKKELWKISLLSACIDVVPLPYVPVAFNAKFLQKYMVDMYKKFGLDSDSLALLARHLNKPVEELRAQIKSTQEKNICTDGIIRNCSKIATSVLVPWIKSFVITSLVTIVLSFISTSIMLITFLDEVVEDALRVSEEALKIKI